MFGEIKMFKIKMFNIFNVYPQKIRGTQHRAYPLLQKVWADMSPSQAPFPAASHVWNELPRHVTSHDVCTVPAAMSFSGSRLKTRIFSRNSFSDFLSSASSSDTCHHRKRL